MVVIGNPPNWKMGWLSMVVYTRLAHPIDMGSVLTKIGLVFSGRHGQDQR
jgi:hypothetical protein